MSARQHALELIADIYDAALEPQRWQETLHRVTTFVAGGESLRLPRPEDSHDWLGIATAVSHLEEGQRERLQILLPHLARAREVMHRLREATAGQSGALTGLDELGCGVVILDERGVHTFINKAARRIFALNDGLRIRGRLFAADPLAQKALEAAIADCLRPEPHARDYSRGLRVPRASKRPDYVVQITSLSRRMDLRAAGAPGTAIVFISDPDSQLRVDKALAGRLYRLTPAETRLAELLVNGETIGSAAKHLGISEATAKTQLQQTFRKTATHRQAELVKLLLSVAKHSS